MQIFKLKFTNLDRTHYEIYSSFAVALSDREWFLKAYPGSKVSVYAGEADCQGKFSFTSFNFTTNKEYS